MTVPPLRVLVADDERPARRLLVDLLSTFDEVQVVSEAATGREAIERIESGRPDLALLDLQMPEMGGLDVVRHLPPAALPLVAFVTAFDDFAIEAFELNAVDYLLKPVERARLADTLERAGTRLAGPGAAESQAAALSGAASTYDDVRRRRYLERIPVRRRHDIVLLPTRQVAAVTADGELLHITTGNRERFTIAYRLHVLERRLDPRRFLRLSRGTLANIDMIATVNAMPNGTYVARLSNGQELPVSRNQSRMLRETLLKL